MTEPETAVAAGLKYVSGDEPGIRRLQGTAGSRYLDYADNEIKDVAVLERIRHLAIPPAYERVWICANPRVHLQATGRDERGRTQYRYNASWRVARDGVKFARMKLFGAALPALRARVRRDLARFYPSSKPRETTRSIASSFKNFEGCDVGLRRQPQTPVTIRIGRNAAP